MVSPSLYRNARTVQSARAQGDNVHGSIDDNTDIFWPANAKAFSAATLPTPPVLEVLFEPGTWVAVSFGDLVARAPESALAVSATVLRCAIDAEDLIGDVVYGQLVSGQLPCSGRNIDMVGAVWSAGLNIDSGDWGGLWAAVGFFSTPSGTYRAPLHGQMVVLGVDVSSERLLQATLPQRSAGPYYLAAYAAQFETFEPL